MGQACQDELADFTHQLTKDVTDIRLDAVNMIHGFADERVSRGVELSRCSGHTDEGIVDDVQNLMGMFKKERIRLQEDLAEAHGIWQNKRTAGGHEYTKALKRIEAKAAKAADCPGKGRRHPQTKDPQRDKSLPPRESPLQKREKK